MHFNEQYFPLFVSERGKMTHIKKTALGIAHSFLHFLEIHFKRFFISQCIISPYFISNGP